jgi:hypothetical protein
MKIYTNNYCSCEFGKHQYKMYKALREWAAHKRNEAKNLKFYNDYTRN